MKNLVIVLAAMFQICMAVHAQSTGDRAGKPFYELVAGGTIRADGEQVGNIKHDGSVFKNGVFVGRVSPSGTVIGIGKDTLGSSDGEGNIFNYARGQVGTLEKDGTLRDARNLRVGAVSGVPRRWAAAIFFFF